MPAPDLAVVVLAHDRHGSVCRAVESLLAGGTPVEIVVSHSGIGARELRASLARYGDAVRFEHTDDRVTPGAARNLGVARTRAPFVAFLASDCVAAPGWAKARLDRHRRGSAVVSSSLEPADCALPTVAEYVLLHSFRMPHLPVPSGHAGASYARPLLGGDGGFPDLPVDEDTVLNDRLARAGAVFAWAPEAVTVHAPPRSLRAMLRDQHRRGREWGALQNRSGTRALLAVGELLRWPLAVRRAWGRGSPVAPWTVAKALPVMVVASACRAAGLLRPGPRGPVEPEARAAMARNVWYRRRLRLAKED